MAPMNDRRSAHCMHCPELYTGDCTITLFGIYSNKWQYGPQNEDFTLGAIRKTC